MLSLTTHGNSGLPAPLATLKQPQFPMVCLLNCAHIPSHQSPAASLPRLALNPEPHIKKTPEAYNLSVRFITVNSQSSKCPHRELKSQLILIKAAHLDWTNCPTLLYCSSVISIATYGYFKPRGSDSTSSPIGIILSAGQLLPLCHFLSPL